jgi:hypothetical protein
LVHDEVIEDRSMSDIHYSGNRFRTFLPKSPQACVFSEELNEREVEDCVRNPEALVGAASTRAREVLVDAP